MVTLDQCLQFQPSLIFSTTLGIFPWFLHFLKKFSGDQASYFIFCILWNSESICYLLSTSWQSPCYLASSFFLIHYYWFFHCGFDHPARCDGFGLSSPWVYPPMTLGAHSYISLTYDEHLKYMEPIPVTHHYMSLDRRNRLISVFIETQ